MQASLGIAVGVLTGPIFDRGHLPIAMILGATLVILGTMTLSLSRSYYQVFMWHDICVGLGKGLMYVPRLTLITSAFDDKRRPWAIGLVTSRTSIGTFRTLSNISYSCKY